MCARTSLFHEMNSAFGKVCRDSLVSTRDEFNAAKPGSTISLPYVSPTVERLRQPRLPLHLVPMRC